MSRLTPAFIAQYREARAWQMETYSRSHSTFIGSDGKRYRVNAGSGGGASEGCHAQAAYWSARRHFHFVKTLRENLKAHKRRSKAARKGWKKRRAA